MTYLDIIIKVPFLAPIDFPNLEAIVTKILKEYYKELATLYINFYPLTNNREIEHFYNLNILVQVRKEV